MTDIVIRLRQLAGQYDEYDLHRELELEAATEIERLRLEIELYRTAEQDRAMQIPPLQAEVARLRHQLFIAQQAAFTEGLRSDD